MNGPNGIRYLRARDAAAELGITLPTLYAYVSRGLIRSQPAGDGSRERRYLSVDVAALKERQAQRRDPRHAAVTALNWGTPLLESAVTLIVGGRLYYRGQDALELARSRRFEEVVGLLWTGRLDSGTGWSNDERPLPAANFDDVAGLAPLERLQARLPLLAASDPAAYDLRQAAVMRAGGRILLSLVDEIAGNGDRPAGIAEALALRLASRVGCASRLIDAALILSADHELNVSSFTVRCVASARAPLYDAIGAGIAALRGVRHGAASRRAEALLEEVGTPERAASVIRDRLRRGEPIPGFGHNLYPEGDPRATLLLELCREAIPGAPALATPDAVIEAVVEYIDERPNVDFGLVVVSRALGLERGSALTLMALGRMAGWVAHALEQYERDQLIRPRARYVGPEPVRDE
jgi:citrate synthase